MGQANGRNTAGSFDVESATAFNLTEDDMKHYWNPNLDQSPALPKLVVCRAIRTTSVLLVCVSIVLCIPMQLVAELPSIRFDRIQPLGLNAGGVLEVEVQGRDFEEANALRFDHPGLVATLVKPGRFKVTATADLPAATYEVRVVGKYGVSNPRLLGVSRGLIDVTDTEPNNQPAEAQSIPLNSAINGISDGNGQDVFQFMLKEGERITIDCQALKLGSQLDANLSLTNSRGEVVASNADYHGRDPFIDFVAPETGNYQVVVNDLIYRGGLPYRLIVSNLPDVENIFPRVAQTGQTVSMTAFGRNLPNSTPSGDAMNLETVRFSFSAPSDSNQTRRFTFLEHPLDHTVAPTAATFTLHGMQIRVPTGEGALRPTCLMLTDQKVGFDLEPNNERAQSQKLDLPVVLSGRFDQPRDADWFEFEIPEKEGGEYSFEVYSERIAGQADPYLGIYDDQGNSLGELDDYGPRVNAFDGHIRDPFGTYNLQPKRKYSVVVQDRYSRGGPRYQYLLTIRRPVPDFDIASIHAENPGPSGLNLWRGGATFLDIILHRHHGFSSAVVLKAEGLPKGVHAAETTLFNSDRTTIVLWADNEAPMGEFPIKIVATGQVNDKTLTRDVRPYTRIWADANPSSSLPMRELVLGIREQAPYTLRFEPEHLTVEQGKAVQGKIIATRYWGDCKDKITVIPLAFPGSIQMPTVEIPAGVNEVPVNFTIQNGKRPGDYTVSVLGQSQVPFHKDPTSKDRPNTLVSTPSRPIRITVTEAPKK